MNINSDNGLFFINILKEDRGQKTPNFNPSQKISMLYRKNKNIRGFSMYYKQIEASKTCAMLLNKNNCPV